MSTDPTQSGSPQRRFVIERANLHHLFSALSNRGCQLVGPTIREGAIVFDVMESVDQLPAGWTDVQDGGKYRLKRREDNALFGFTVGPHSWKKFLYPAEQRLFRATKTDGRIEFLADQLEAPRYAFIGVRSCDLHAIFTQDKVFMGGRFVDPGYKARRERAFIVVLNCGQAGGTCFCASMRTGPRAESGFDLALTEILEEDRHYFLAETGSDEGAQVLGEIPNQAAGDDEIAAADRAVARASSQMGRTMDIAGIKELLYRNYEHPRWESVAERCLTCANCTMVCPTCFCTTVEDVTDLTGEHAERWRKWDSCFTMDFSRLTGGSVRASTKSRYRQWMTHKLATWHDQFGMSGCVGCGRCITWCPVAIDITEEVRAIRRSERQPQPDSDHNDPQAERNHQT